MPAADVSCRHALNDSQSLGVLLGEMKLLFIRRIDFDKWFWLFQLDRESGFAVLHEVLLSMNVSKRYP